MRLFQAVTAVHFILFVAIWYQTYRTDKMGKTQSTLKDRVEHAAKSGVLALQNRSL
eukprot:m.5246 g.5246  ORF g.5246 m.5246 type:complete len:56 (+) comp7520_c0_seq1:1065-1232(+)